MISPPSATLAILLPVLLLGKRVASAQEISPSNARWFAYMKTASKEDDGPRKNRTHRTHVFALTTSNDLVERYMNVVDRTERAREEELRRLRENDDVTVPADDDERDQEVKHDHVSVEAGKLCQYESVLKFPTVKDRIHVAHRLYEAVQEYNGLVTSFNGRLNEDQCTTQIAELLINVTEPFGPHFDEEANAMYPTEQELNTIHDQFAPLFVKVRNLAFTDDAEDGADGVGIDHNKAISQSLSFVNDYVHELESYSEWLLENRFSFNKLKNGPCWAYRHYIQEVMRDEDFELQDEWRMQLEFGGLFFSYPHTGKDLQAIMHTNDFGFLETDELKDQLLFTDRFNPVLYVVWSLDNTTEAQTRSQFQRWWVEQQITEKYGFEYGNPRQQNGHFRFGQQVCFPSSDCDRMRSELLDEFSETPVVIDFELSQERPYGETDDDLRFFGQSNDDILA